MIRPIRKELEALLSFRKLGPLLVLVALTAPAASASTDPGFKDQWGLTTIRAPSAWARSQGAGIVVAVVDSGVDLAHEDLAGQLVPGRNFIEPGRSPQDDNGHGTHVAGIVAAATGNGRGVASVAPEAKIMPVRVLRDDGTGEAEGDSADVVAGIRWAADNGAHVINLSLGENVVVRTVLGPSMTEGLEYAWSKGAIPVVAAGNDLLFPSGYGDVNAIVVSATDRRDMKPSYSNGVGSAKWGMAAPGGRSGNEGVLSTWRGNGYAFASGTSMAAPHVAGAAALLRSLGFGPRETVEALMSTADDIGAAGPDPTFGAGRLNAERAVALAPRAATVADPPRSSARDPSVPAAPAQPEVSTRAGDRTPAAGDPASNIPAPAAPDREEAATAPTERLESEVQRTSPTGDREPSVWPVALLLALAGAGGAVFALIKSRRSTA